jgi:hypothetical protein
MVDHPVDHDLYIGNSLAISLHQPLHDPSQRSFLRGHLDTPRKIQTVEQVAAKKYTAPFSKAPYDRDRFSMKTVPLVDPSTFSLGATAAGEDHEKLGCSGISMLHCKTGCC